MSSRYSILIGQHLPVRTLIPSGPDPIGTLVPIGAQKFNQTPAIAAGGREREA